MSSWVRLGMSLAVVPLLVSMAVVHFLMSHQALGAFDDVAARYRDERAPLNDLRIELWEAQAPVSAYLEDRQPTEPALYRERRVAVESGFARLQTVFASDRAMSALLARAQDDWSAADRIAAGLLAHPSAPGDSGDAALESELDARITAAADKLRAICTQLDRAIEADHSAAERATERALWVSVIAAVLSLLMVVLGVTVISRIMLRNVHRLVEGARRFAEGDRSHRIEIGVPPELREVATEFNRMIGKIDEAEELLAAQARHDPLTGLENRRAFDEAIDASLARMRRVGEQFFVAAIDVDHFKKVNDTYGHGAGDDVLRSIGETLRSTIREVDRAFRIGGEEFVVLLTDCDAKGAFTAAERLRAKIAATGIPTAGTELRVSASFGLAEATPTGSVAELLRTADTALYAAKAGGRNRIEVAQPQN
jgi:diguanylate cyclase (GGDEF)-like protein